MNGYSSAGGTVPFGRRAGNSRTYRAPGSQGQITVVANGASGSPKLVSVQANANPTATPTRINTPRVSPTRSATRTLLRTATRTPTATPAPQAGRGFTLQVGAQPQLTWQGGTETGVLVIRWDAPANVFAFLPPPANPLGFLVNNYTDPGPLPGETYCYVLLVLGSNPPSISDVRGLSDLYCVYPQTATGTPPSGFKVRLDQGPIVYLNWNPVPNATSYELTAMRFDGTLPRSITLQGAATSFAEEHGGLSTCYRLVAKNGGGEIGGTQQLCAAPGVSSFTPNGATGLSLQGALDRLAGQRSPGIRAMP